MGITTNYNVKYQGDVRMPTSFGYHSLILVLEVTDLVFL